MSCRQSSCALLACVLLFISLPLLANTQAKEPANYVFAAYMGGGLYNGTDNSLFILNMPMTFDWPNQPDYRIRFTVSAGFYNYGEDQIGDLELPDEVGTLSLIPGIEKVFHINDHWELTPYLDFGWGENYATHESTTVYSTGIQSRYYLAGDYENHVWVNKLIYAGYKTRENGVRDNYVKMLTGYDYKFGSFIPVLGKQLVPTVYGSIFWSYNGVDYKDHWQASRIRNELNYELGFTLYTSRSFDLWITELNRIGFGYQYTPQGDLIRLFIGTPF